MSASLEPAGELFQLSARAPDEGTRIEVLNGNLDPVRLPQNLGEISAKLPAGAYAVRFWRGGQFCQRNVILSPQTPNASVYLSEADAPKFSTAAPVPQTETTREFHREPARELSKTAPLAPPPGQNGGSHLLVFVRDLEIERSGDPANGLTLHDADGALLFDFTRIGLRDSTKGWAGAHLNLDPGAYRLRFVTGRGSFAEQMLYTHQGWQTQAFLLARPSTESDPGRMADPARVSVLMARAGEGFDFNREDLRWTEAALRALEDNGNIPGSTRTEMLWEKFSNPMLGIYAGLLHLRRREIDATLMRQVVGNLRGLVEALPDVLAIGWALAARDEQTRNNKLFMEWLHQPGRLANPPMLRESWAHLLNATVAEPGLIPDESLSNRVACQLLSRGPWIAWLGEPRAASKAPPIPLPKVPTLLKVFGVTGEALEKIAGFTLDAAFPLLARVLAETPDAGAQLYSDRFTDVERRVAQFVYPLVDPQLNALAEENPAMKRRILDGLADRRQSPGAVVRALRLPTGSVLRAAWDLFRKLRMLPVIPNATHLGTFVIRESRDSARLREVLEATGTVSTSIRHPRSSRVVNGLEYLYLRYQGSPAQTESGPPKPEDLAALLNLAEYHAESGKQPVTPATLEAETTSLRTHLIARLRPAVESGDLKFDADWEKYVLPPLTRYKPGQLLPAPVVTQVPAPPASVPVSSTPSGKAPRKKPTGRKAKSTEPSPAKQRRKPKGSSEPPALSA